MTRKATCILRLEWPIGRIQAHSKQTCETLSYIASPFLSQKCLVFSCSRVAKLTSVCINNLIFLQLPLCPALNRDRIALFVAAIHQSGCCHFLDKLNGQMRSEGATNQVAAIGGDRNPADSTIDFDMLGECVVADLQRDLPALQAPLGDLLTAPPFY